ncbi:MAG: HD domain-containing phosphohydrolase [Gemmatimonadota bacterium]
MGPERKNLILVIDDQEANTRVLCRLIEREGLARTCSTNNPLEAVRLFTEMRPDLVVVDLHMPEVDGFAVLAQLRPLTWGRSFLPIVIVTGDDSAESRRRALSEGASDFLAKPYDAVEVLLRLRNLLETRRLHLLLERHSESLEGAVRERTRELSESQLETLHRLAAAAEMRDDDTGRHTQRVGEMAARLAELLGHSPESVQIIRQTAPLHDVGKIGIPDAVLLKPGRLDSAEMAIIQTHTTIGARILAGGRSPLVAMAASIARSHHERWDGSGYPDQTVGATTPIEARIVAVVDVFDALSHDRPYRKAWPEDRVRKLLAEGRGSHFDPEVVDVFLAHDWSEFVAHGEPVGVEA